MLRRLLLTLWYACTALVVAAALGLSLGRLALPLLEARTGQLEAWVKEAIGQEVEIGRLELSWYGFGPELRVHDIALRDGTPNAAQEAPLLKARELRIALDSLRSLWAWRPVPSRLVVVGSALSLSRTADGRIEVQGIHAQTPQINPWLLVLSQPHVELRDIRVQWHDARGAIPDIVLSNIGLRLRNSGRRHQLQVDLQLPAEYGTQLQFSADLNGASAALAESFRDWRGELYVAFSQAPLARWLGQYAPAGWRMDGTVDTALWAKLEAGALQQLRGSLQIAQPYFARTDVQAAVFTAERIATRLDWHREKDTGWQLNLAGLQVDLGGQTNQTGQSGLETALTLLQHSRSDGTRQWQLAADRMQIEALSPLLALHPAITVEQRTRLQHLQPAGTLSEVRVDAATRADGGLDALVYRLHLQDLRTTAADRLPGVAALSGRMSGDLMRGTLELDSRAAHVDLPKLFRAPLQLAQVSGRIDWRRGADRLHIESAALRAENADIRTLSRLLLEIPNDGSKPFLELQTSFTDGNVEATHNYLPVGIMPPRTVAWLDRALVSGRLHDGALLFQGRFGAFPFDHADGRLEVRATVSDGVLDYQDGWHRIEGLEAELAFVNRSMNIHGVAGKILGSELPDVSVRIDDLAHARLDIDGQATGTLTDMLRFLRESPLSEGRREALDALQASGDTHLHLAIRLPLGKTVPGKLDVDGRVQLHDNRLDLPGWELALEQLKGELQFTQSGLYGRDLTARLLGVPVKLDVGDASNGDVSGGDVSADEALTRVRARGKLPLVEKLRKTQPTLERIKGGSAWSAALYLPKRAATNTPARVELQSDLSGIQVDLPEPFGKPAEAATTFVLTAELQGRAFGPLRMQYGNHSAAFTLTRNNGALQLARGALKLGAADAALPEDDSEGVRVAGSVPVFAWDAWRELLGGGEQTGMLRALDVDIDSLRAFGRIFNGVQIRAQRDSGHWIATLGGPDMDGTLELPPEKPVLLRCTRLHIPAAADTGGSTDNPTGSATARLDPASVPPLDVDVQQLQFRDLQLGHVNLKTQSLAAGMAVDALQVEAEWLHFGAQGEWTRSDDRDTSRFRIDMQDGNLGKMLTAFGYAGSIEGGATKGTIDAHWPGTPADFSLAKLDGSLDVRIGQGRLLNVEAGAGRVFGLFSLQGLRRRLALDFSDVFAKGFSFDRIAGRFNLQGGDAYTDNLVIDGPAARIEVSGRTGLARRDYDQVVTVVPQVQSTLPIAGAIAGGPAVGAALLLADKLLGKQIEGLTRFARYQYTVTGSWDEPKFQSVSSEAARGLQEKSVQESTQESGQKSTPELRQTPQPESQPIPPELMPPVPIPPTDRQQQDNP
ncbi:MAG: TIGR02099 family protein [Gammaproteobacteria bacterium]|nr:TIGR02099 family protein [Gammaproteobacteria bacterium]